MKEKGFSTYSQQDRVYDRQMEAHDAESVGCFMLPYLCGGFFVVQGQVGGDCRWHSLALIIY